MTITTFENRSLLKQGLKNVELSYRLSHPISFFFNFEDYDLLAICDISRYSQVQRYIISVGLRLASSCRVKKLNTFTEQTVIHITLHRTHEATRLFLILHIRF